MPVEIRQFLHSMSKLLIFSPGLMNFKPLLWLVTAVFFSTCTSTAEGEFEEIQSYLLNNNLSAEDTSGVYVAILLEGTKEKPVESSIIEMSYTGKYLDNTVFDKSPANDPIKVKLSALIDGLRYGISKFGKGGKGIILIPSALGYGNNPPYGIRKNAILIYEVNVINF